MDLNAAAAKAAVKKRKRGRPPTNPLPPEADGAADENERRRLARLARSRRTAAEWRARQKQTLEDLTEELEAVKAEADILRAQLENRGTVDELRAEMKRMAGQLRAVKAKNSAMEKLLQDAGIDLNDASVQGLLDGTAASLEGLLPPSPVIGTAGSMTACLTAGGGLGGTNVGAPMSSALPTARPAAVTNQFVPPSACAGMPLGAQHLTMPAAVMTTGQQHGLSVVQHQVTSAAAAAWGGVAAVQEFGTDLLHLDPTHDLWNLDPIPDVPGIPVPAATGVQGSETMTNFHDQLLAM